MPLEVLRGSPRVLKHSLPSNLQKVDFEHLQLGRDFANTYFQGTVVFSYRLTKLGNGTPFFKIVLQGSENSSSEAHTINIFVFGKLAEECAKAIHQGDILVVTGFNLVKSNNKNDKHGWHLELSDEVDSKIYVFTRSPHITTVSETVAMPVAPKYTYTPLNQLKSGTVVNLYGVVKFFKPPYVSKGTDYCSVVTVVDQSSAKFICTLFNTNRDALPRIYRNGDIVRFHRIKVREFGGEIQGIGGKGFAALTFDGTVGAPVVPRTTSKLFTFTDEDRRIVENLRIWVARNPSNSKPAVKLSDIQPPMFFELTCQLVGKAKVDGSSYLLKVWDGTKCPFPSWKVLVKDDDLEGDRILINQLKNLTVDIIIYDNHVQLAKSLKVGSFIRLYSLHAKMKSPEGKPDITYIQFHLHGGTMYGRGITILPETQTDAMQLKAFLDSVDLTASEYSDESSSPEFENIYTALGTCLERCQQLSVTVLTDHQHLDVTALSTILNSRIPQQFRVRAKLRRYEPVKLHQSVKLHCPKCNLLQEIPGGAEIDLVLREASLSRSNPDLQNASFYESAVWESENEEQRHVTVHFVKHDDLLQEAGDSLILIEGGILKEILKLSKKFKAIIPVRSTEDSLVLLDPSVPFFWQRNMQYFGCKHCSDPKPMSSLSSLAAEEDPSWNSMAIAQALGVVPLQYVFVMKFVLDDGTGTLDVYLMDCDKFFQIPASEVLINNIFQENMERMMSKLCPTGKDLDELPWLECFIKSYYVRDETQEQLCYQIFDTMIAEDV
ncbi:protection of telomeres protein 1 isoform X1 [Pogona vitticeps]